jgi:hypothetical protein
MYYFILQSYIFFLNVLKSEYSQNTTSVEKMVYSAIETTCFGLYWPSSGFYSINPLAPEFSFKF